MALYTVFLFRGSSNTTLVEEQGQPTKTAAQTGQLAACVAHQQIYVSQQMHSKSLERTDKNNKHSMVHWFPRHILSAYLHTFANRPCMEYVPILTLETS